MTAEPADTGVGDDIRYQSESLTAGAEPSRSYGTSSGWSGTGTSKARAESQDATGKTAVIQQYVLARMSEVGSFGATTTELRLHPRNADLNYHHGSISSALSNLHKDGRLSRLTEVRGGSKVYVLPNMVDGRATEEQGYRGLRGRSKKIRKDRYQLEFGSPCGCGSYVLPFEQDSHTCAHQEVGEFRPATA